jgi:hypothetical protein
MLGRRKWRTVGVLVIALGAVVGTLGWLVLGSEEAYQRRIAHWGGWTREMPPVSHPFFKFRQQIRHDLGDRVCLMLLGSPGRIVGNGPPPGKAADWQDATAAQLAELLEAQPILVARLSGSKHLGDDWLAGLKYPEAMGGLGLDGSQITDQSADILAKMRKLGGLSLVDTAISDVTVFRLCRLPNLFSLSVGGPNIRSIRLLDHRLLDESGTLASRAGGKLRLEGLVEMTGLPGTTENIRVIVRPEGIPALPEIFPKQELSLIEMESPWSYHFRIDLAGLPPGRSSVEVWIDHRPGFTTSLVQYRMRPFAIELATPEPVLPEGAPR